MRFRSLYFVLEIYLLNEDLKHDETENFKYLKAIKDFDNVFPQYLIGKHYLDCIGTKKKIDKAQTYFEKAIRNNHDDSYYNLGLCYMEKHYNAKAVNCFLKAADLDYSLAQKKVGKFYDEGEHVPKNKFRAFYYYKLSSQSGDRFGLLKVGNCYNAGFGTRENSGKAIECYKKCGYDIVFIRMSKIYLSEKPFVDFKKSMKYLRQIKNKRKNGFVKIFRKT